MDCFTALAKPAKPMEPALMRDAWNNVLIIAYL